MIYESGREDGQGQADDGRLPKAAAFHPADGADEAAARHAPRGGIGPEGRAGRREAARPARGNRALDDPRGA